ncbi:hypothetical protein [Larkinella soli]|uniref:hypothetical protein n=1 Tax=Larkinella soli TaxID=1770527 RepID=UPI000FFC5534|nr:hypothetical protein [Larkinella soli]
MKWLIAGLLLLSYLMPGQSTLNGLGRLVIGQTTADALLRLGFRELDPPLVKGTIALPCSHLRIFQTDRFRYENHIVSDLTAILYDDRLFWISCDLTDSLKTAFIGRHGPGRPAPQHRPILCRGPEARPLTLSSVSWLYGEVQALAVTAEGTGADCRNLRAARLNIVDRTLLAVTTECDLEGVDPLFETARKVLPP